MSDRTGQIWKLGGGAIFLIVEPSKIATPDPRDEFGLEGSHEHKAFELERGYFTTLVELNEGDWEDDGFRKRLL